MTKMWFSAWLPALLLLALLLSGLPAYCQSSNLEQDLKGLEAEIAKQKESDDKWRSDSEQLSKAIGQLNSARDQLAQNKLDLEAAKDSLGNDIRAYNKRLETHVGAGKQLEAANKELRRVSEPLQEEKLKIDRDDKALAALRPHVDRTKHSQVDSFNERFDALEARMANYNLRVDNFAKRVEQVKKNSRAYDEEAQVLERIRTSLRVRLQKLSEASARNHAEAVRLESVAKNLRVRQEELTSQRKRLEESARDLNRRVDAFNAKVKTVGAGMKSLRGYSYDETTPKSMAGQDELTKAKEDARKAEEEKKRLEMKW